MMFTKDDKFKMPGSPEKVSVSKIREAGYDASDRLTNRKSFIKGLNRSLIDDAFIVGNQGIAEDVAKIIRKVCGEWVEDVEIANGRIVSIRFGEIPAYQVMIKDQMSVGPDGKRTFTSRTFTGNEIKEPATADGINPDIEFVLPLNRLFNDGGFAEEYERMPNSWG